MSASHGRILIYVWAIEQDQLSKRSIPEAENSVVSGTDVFVPWVLSTDSGDERSQVFQRYYHMFSDGELQNLVRDAAGELGLCVGNREDAFGRESGVQIVQNGWERSNYYIELWRWKL